jgi:hypothetical protein
MEAAACAKPATEYTYARREPEKTALYGVMQEHLLTFEQQWTDGASGKTLPKFVTDELRAYLNCGILGRGFAHLYCKRILRFLQRRKVITLVTAPADGEVTVVGDETMGEKDPLLAKLLAAATAGAAPAGPANKRKPVRIVLDPDDRPIAKGNLCGQARGFNLHAATKVAVPQASASTWLRLIRELARVHQAKPKVAPLQGLQRDHVCR